MRGIHHVFVAGQADAGQTTQSLHHAKDIFSFRIEACADGGAAEIDFAQAFLYFVKTPAVTGNGFRPGGEFLTQGNWNGILHFRSAQLQDAGEFGFLFLQCSLKLGACFRQGLQQPDSGQTKRRRVHIIGGLGQVDMIQGMDQGIIALLPAQQFDGPVGDDFVQVHVGGSAGAALQGIHRELVGQVAVGDFGGCLENGRTQTCIQQPQRHIHFHGGLLDGRQGPDQFRMDKLPGNTEIFHGPHGMDSIIGVDRNILCAEKIIFRPHPVDLRLPVICY